MMIQEAFQYPTRLGRQGAQRAGRLLFMFRSPRFCTERAGRKKDGGAAAGASVLRIISVCGRPRACRRCCG